MIEWFVTGIIGSPYGLNGFVKVNPLSGETSHLLRLKSVILRKNGKEKPHEIEEILPMKPAVIMRFKDITNPEEAKILSGSELLVKREDAAELKKGEYYIEDLKGLAVISNGDSLGHILSLIEGGTGHLVEIKLNDGSTRLVPFKNYFFPEINVEKGYVTINNLWILE